MFYIIRKLLKLRCLKWAHITHLDIWNTSYGQKKGRESNWQFDSQPLKIKNRPNLLVCKWRATYHWKALNKGHNFASDNISIWGMHAKLWAPKVADVPGQNAIWMWASWRGTEYTIGGRWWLPPSSSHGESCESELHVACFSTKSAPTMH